MADLTDIQRTDATRIVGEDELYAAKVDSYNQLYKMLYDESKNINLMNMELIPKNKKDTESD